jgi:hypothetical protein
MESQSTTMKPPQLPTFTTPIKSASEPMMEPISSSIQTGKNSVKPVLKNGAPLLKSALAMQQENELHPREKRQIRISQAVASQWGQFIETANKHLKKSLIL